ncbi:MAG: hypothetical protein LBG80_12805, partial [Bacteroidales bacterium]|nr:hypothetical protein [Bacteroidales bacterium]
SLFKQIIIGGNVGNRHKMLAIPSIIEKNSGDKIIVKMALHMNLFLVIFIFTYLCTHRNTNNLVIKSWQQF